MDFDIFGMFGNRVLIKTFICFCYNLLHRQVDVEFKSLSVLFMVGNSFSFSFNLVGLIESII